LLLAGVVRHAAQIPLGLAQLLLELPLRSPCAPRPQFITAFARGGKSLTVWVCKEEVDDDDGPPSYTLLKTSNNKRWCMNLPMWSVVYKYKLAMWNGNFREPKVEGIVRNSDVTAAAEAAEDFDWDEFKHEGDGKSDSKTNVDSGDEELE
jgi:hypothetical protein